MHKIILFSFFGALSIAGIACNLLTAENPSLDYPTAYPVLELSEVQQMNEEYQSANNNHICSTLDKYGFTGFSELFFEDGQSPCANRVITRTEMNNSDTLISTAKASLSRNEEYTGVQDSAKLEVKELVPLYGCTICEGPDVNNVPIEWKVTFENQKVDTIEIKGTEIAVFIDAKGVNRIWGNWYPDITIPDIITYGYLDVQEGMAGWQIDMRPYTGEEEIYTVKAGDISGIPRKVLYATENEDQQQLEIRYCWELRIEYEGQNFDGWRAYVDIEEGLLIDLVSQ